MQQDAEKRRHEREDIHFNVVIIGDTGIQRGCRVLNVSETGMMLMWSARKDDPKVKGGDLLYPIDSKVDLLFMFGRTEKRSFSFSGRVLWSEWNLLGVEFDQPNPALMNIISAHTSGETAAEPHARETMPPPPAPNAPGPSNRAGTLLKLFSGLATIALVAVLTAWFLGAPEPPGADLATRSLDRGAANVITPIPEAVRSKRKAVAPATITIVEPGEGQTVSGRLEVTVVTRGDTPPERVELHVAGKRIASRSVGPWLFGLDTRDYPDGDLELRAVALDGFGGRVIDSRHLAVENAPVEHAEAVPVAFTDTGMPDPTAPIAPPPAAERTADTAPAIERTGDTPPDPQSAGALKATDAGAAVEAEETVTATAPVTEPVEEAAASTAGETSPAPVAEPKTTPGGGWFVNLITLSNKNSADRLTERANAEGFPVVQEPTIIGGEPLWRLRLYGFWTREEANAYGAEVQEALGLKEFLVRRRR